MSLNNMGSDARKPDFVACKQQGPEQPGHMHRLVSDFIVCYLESITAKPATILILIAYWQCAI